MTDVGVRMPAPWTASGLALLAALPREQVRALFPEAGSFVARDGAPSTPRALREALQAVRADGIARERDTVTPGLSSVAVAVDSPGRVGVPAAAVAVTYEHERVSAEEVAAMEAATQEAAAEVARRLG